MDRTLFVTLLAYTTVLLFIYLLFTILSPFLGLLVWAIAIGVITQPAHRKILALCSGREVPAAALMTTVVVLTLILPAVWLAFALIKEATAAYHFFEQVGSGTSQFTPAQILDHPAIAPWLKRITPLTGYLHLELDSLLLPAIKKSLATLLNYSTDIVRNLFGFLFKLMLMLITLFFIYKDGERMLENFWQLVAIGEKLRNTIVETVTRVLGAVMYGVILTCFVQGVLGGIGFYVAGLPSPFLFGTLMTICAPIPFVGTALVWLPGAIYLLLNGETLSGILLIVWGAAAVGSIDNILRPLFISGKARLPILVIIFGVLGGVLSFGFAGVVAGPVIIAVLLVLIRRESLASFGREQGSAG